MPSPVSNNKRIAKNTLYMYLRMLFTMGVGLYTSRVVLATLGAADFGTYNVVAGVIVLFSFINSAMTTSTQRYLSYELGKPEGNVSNVFSSCLSIHIGLAIILLLILETGGLWFLNNRMNFSGDRMSAVNWCYQFSVCASLLSIVRAPFNALIVAKEKFSFYAYLGILEAILKLAIVYLLLISSIDKLVLYSALMLGVVFFIIVICCIYCFHSFLDIRHFQLNRTATTKDILSFSGWAFFGSLANVGLSQGINVIINIFYGVLVNAAFGIANQVNSQITALVGGFQQALNPQLTKSEAEGDREKQFSLICMSSKFSFLIMTFISCPLLLNLDYILRLWLGTVPNFTHDFVVAIIIGALIETFSGPLWVTIFATGEIKVYQIVISFVLLLNLPFAYLAGLLNISPELIFHLRNIIFVVAFCTRLFFLKRLIDFNVKEYMKYSIGPALLVCVLLSPLFIFLKNHIIVHNLSEFFLLLLLTITYEAIIIFWKGLNVKERILVTSLIKNKIIKSYHNR